MENNEALYNNYKQSIYQKQGKMDSCLIGLKEPKFVISQESGQASTEKLLCNQDTHNPREPKLQKSQNQNAIFQINSLVLTETRPNFDTLALQIDQNQPLAESNKVEAKNKKRKKVIDFALIFNSYYEFLEARLASLPKVILVDYYERRSWQSEDFGAGKIDLGVCTMREVVEFCNRKSIISGEVYVEYSFEPCFIQEEKFISKLNQKKFDDLELDKMYFNPFDHRLLCSILAQNFPHQFKFPARPTLQNLKLTAFYNYLYDLSHAQYLNLIRNLNEKLNRSWMPNDFEIFGEEVNQKLQNQPNKKQDQSYPFHLPARKLRKKF